MASTVNGITAARALLAFEDSVKEQYNGLNTLFTQSPTLRTTPEFVRAVQMYNINRDTLYGQQLAFRNLLIMQVQRFSPANQLATLLPDGNIVQKTIAQILSLIPMPTKLPTVGSGPLNGLHGTQGLGVIPVIGFGAAVVALGIIIGVTYFASATVQAYFDSTTVVQQQNNVIKATQDCINSGKTPAVCATYLGALPKSKDAAPNYALWIGLGAGAVVLISVGAYFMFKKSPTVRLSGLKGLKGRKSYALEV